MTLVDSLEFGGWAPGLPVWLTTVDKDCIMVQMSGTTMSFALPTVLREYIDERVRTGPYGNTSEYLRDLIRRDQESLAKERLRTMIEQGLRSGPNEPLTMELADELRSRALDPPR